MERTLFKTEEPNSQSTEPAVLSSGADADSSQQRDELMSPGQSETTETDLQYQSEHSSRSHTPTRQFKRPPPIDTTRQAVRPATRRVSTQQIVQPIHTTRPAVPPERKAIKERAHPPQSQVASCAQCLVF